MRHELSRLKTRSDTRGPFFQSLAARCKCTSRVDSVKVAALEAMSPWALTKFGIPILVTSNVDNALNRKTISFNKSPSVLVCDPKALVNLFHSITPEEDD